MKYDKDLTKKLIEKYSQGISVPELALWVSEIANEDVPERSIIAKLAACGVYKKKEYLTKRGEVPVKKEEYIDRISNLLGVSVDMLESLEKVNKNVLALLAERLDRPSAAVTEEVNYFQSCP